MHTILEKLIQARIDFYESLPYLYPGTKVKDIRVEGNCVYASISPPIPPTWINLDPGLRLDEQPTGSIRAKSKKL